MLVTSAPGKVILFGEHAVVHGVPAIAASIDLHTYVFVKAGDPEIVELDFPMVDLVAKWRVKDLPFTTRGVSTVLDQQVIESLEPLLSGIANSFARAAAQAFLYLYVHLCTAQTPGKLFVTRSTLPVGAGLGSSASFSVALSAALLLLGNGIPDPSDEPDSKSREIINAWSYLGESCIHGNPSGIDNVVATNGGAVRYRRTSDGPVVEPYISFPVLDLVLTNTKVSRHTSQLVAGVGALRKEYPAIVDPILESVTRIVEQAHESISNEKDPKVLNETLSALADINHGLLVALGVSHLSLEQIRGASQATKLGATKLTGAGGGGCAITIVDPGSAHTVHEFRSLVPDFEVLETTLGGRGVAATKVESNNVEADLENIERLKTWRHW